MHLAAGFADHPLPNGEEQSKIFRGFQEFIGRNQPLLRMLPAQQSFESDSLICIEVNNRLITELELPSIERCLQLALQRETPQGLFVHGLIKHITPRASTGL